jgi:hypothetical protein
MAEEATDKTKQNLEIQPYCPLTGVWVLEYSSKQFSISGLSVTWWHCPACKGWHILTTKTSQEKEFPRAEPFYQPSSV